MPKFRSTEDPWKCEKTGNCCRRFVYGGPEVRSKRKIDSIAEEMKKLGFSGEEISQFRENRTVPTSGEEPPKKCIFLEDNLCQIYDLRPRQCKRYPLEIGSEAGDILILIDSDCPRAERIGKAIERRNIPGWLEDVLEGREIKGIKLRSFYEEKMASYRDEP